MKFQVVDLVAAEPAACDKGEQVQVSTMPHISLSVGQVGFILSKHSFNADGVVCLGGIVHPEWAGYITVELVALQGPLAVVAGEKVAHLVVFTETVVLGGTVL